ncbi:tyrosine protein kinase SWE1 Ecym_8129 [Eremothecium cymbalariae DBVPG|uniref:Protein kinase domain-containing protein n=1 Tax=Eremothecium cymbalariae (strain CBS 270.75 / DBVPG 7215 / KCTC 17166 / NRRL Y-17582) TaxID=931890 RepID=G8JX46_ERECY|nr:Hypothetical protein Ecym_8129 [Eremothecium cymbalariae DBVPG\
MASGHSSITAMDQSPFIRTHHNISPTLQFNQGIQEDDELSDFDLDSETREFSNASNNLRFYSSRQSPGLTRSVGTLNLSLENTGLNAAALSSGETLSRIHEEDGEEDGVSVCYEPPGTVGRVGEDDLHRNMKRWISFSPKYDKKLKRTASKSEVRTPLIPVNFRSLENDSNIQRLWMGSAASPFGNKRKMRKPLEPLQSFTDVKPDQSAFQQKGLISKLHSSLFPQKLAIPDTPVKRSPHSSIMDSPMDSSTYHSLTTVHDSKFLKHSPPVIPPSMSPINSSPTHPLRLQRPCSARDHHMQRKKRSKVIKNTELANKLQQFTDDLFGNSDEDPLFNSSPLEGSKKPEVLLNAMKSYHQSPTRFTLQHSQCKHMTKHRSINATLRNPDEHLSTRFSYVTMIGKGQFSTVYQVCFPETQMKYAIKSMAPKKHNLKSRIIQEIRLLSEISAETRDDEGKEYIIQFISSWEYQGSFYLMTELCENGNLDQFLQEQLVARSRRLEDWRIWKIIVEICLALRFIHDSCSIVHLDLKPANIMITFEGTLKLGDLGMATKLPLVDKNFENEGDREYIAPEIISDSIYDFKADIFSLGLIIVEIAANVVLPDNGNAWHKLRSGDLSDAGRLSSTEIYSDSIFSSNNINNTHLTDTTRPSYSVGSGLIKTNTPAWVPRFLIDTDSLERMVIWMIEPDYRKRPSAKEILQTEECQYVELTRKAGAVIQEDDFGPKPEFFA